jgi:hypothetical protein
MTEPEYIYLRGYGWVPRTDPEQIVFRDHWGYDWLIIKRMPESGERWTAEMDSDIPTQKVVDEIIKRKYHVYDWSYWQTGISILYKTYYAILPA